MSCRVKVRELSGDTANQCRKTARMEFDIDGVGGKRYRQTYNRRREMKTYIINLERSRKRREHALGEAQKHQLDFELFQAVDGFKLSDVEIEEYCDIDAIKRAPNWLTPGMLGCSLSHYRVYQKILDDGIDHAFVLEDDAILPPDINALLSDISEAIKSNEVISLYYMSFQPNPLSIQDVVDLTSGFSLHYPMDINKTISTAGYVITKEAAKSLLKILRPIRVSPDSWGYFYERNGFESFRCVYPMPIKITASQSDIHSHNLRGRITRFIDENNVPLLASIIRKKRNRNIEQLTRVELVDKKSEISN